MKWYNNLYLSAELAPEAKKVIRKIKKESYTPDVYLITIARTPGNLLEIIPSYELLQKGYPKEEILVIGLSYGWLEAAELVREIVDEVYQVTGGLDVKSYLRGKWRDASWK